MMDALHRHLRALRSRPRWQRRVRYDERISLPALPGAGGRAAQAGGGGLCLLCRAFRGATNAYRHSVEHSVHVRDDVQPGHRQRWCALFSAGAGPRARSAPSTRPMPTHCACHARLWASERVGLLRQVGHKFGRWLDLAFLGNVSGRADSPGNAIRTCRPVRAPRCRRLASTRRCWCCCWRRPASRRRCRTCCWAPWWRGGLPPIAALALNSGVGLVLLVVA